MKKMLKKGKLRADNYSMLGKSMSDFSQQSVLSSSKKKDRVFGHGISPTNRNMLNVSHMSSGKKEFSLGKTRNGRTTFNS